MRTLLAAVAAAALLAATPALAGSEAKTKTTEIKGQIQSIDKAARTMIMKDGTRLQLAEGVSTAGLSRDTEVTVTVQPSETGDPVATQVELPGE